jgi:hypothetical protein
VVAAVQALLAVQEHPVKVLQAGLLLQIPVMALAAAAAHLRLVLTVQAITAVTAAPEPHRQLLVRL